MSKLKNTVGPEVNFAHAKDSSDTLRRYRFYNLFDAFEDRFGKPPPKCIWEEIWERSLDATSQD